MKSILIKDTTREEREEIIRFVTIEHLILHLPKEILHRAVI